MPFDNISYKKSDDLKPLKYICDYYSIKSWRKLNIKIFFPKKFSGGGWTEQ